MEGKRIAQVRVDPIIEAETDGKAVEAVGEFPAETKQ
jgi:hypothetical protein